MQSEERFGLTKRHGYDEIVAWIKSDPKGVPYPDRVAFKTYDSPVYAQLRDALRTNTEPQDAFNAYQQGGISGRSSPRGRGSPHPHRVAHPIPQMTTTTI